MPRAAAAPTHGAAMLLDAVRARRDLERRRSDQFFLAALTGQDEDKTNIIQGINNVAASFKRERALKAAKPKSGVFKGLGGAGGASIGAIGALAAAPFTAGASLAFIPAAAAIGGTVGAGIDAATAEPGSPQQAAFARQATSSLQGALSYLTTNRWYDNGGPPGGYDTGAPIPGGPAGSVEDYNPGTAEVPYAPPQSAAPAPAATTSPGGTYASDLMGNPMSLVDWMPPADFGS